MPKALGPRDKFEKQLAMLVDKYSQQESEYKRADYTESQARVDFVDPFFEALGWDVRNVQRLAWDIREVIVESGQTSGRPDYNFRLNGKTQFFVEAKAPHVPLDSSRVILQAKKYAFNETSQMVLLSGATDFEEFRLYEVRDISYLHRVNKGLIFKYRYDEYLTPKALDDLWKIGRESVAAGSLDILITPAARRERQRIPLDQQFLSDLEAWREKLAKSVFKVHREMDAPDLNSVVQVFLDRLIFIRVAEDRGVLPANQLWEIVRHWTENKSRPIISELLPLFRAVNQKLNGDIFKPHRAEEINWDSALVAEIVEDGLEPYNFGQIGVELLGSIYERYLGKTIRVTDTRAIIEEKPEVRKAGGVYYTPKYIVDFIIKQTVGIIIEGKTPKQIEKLKFLDPACGSGSFLLGAYQALLDYHTRYYAEKSKKKKEGQPRLIDATENGEFRLSLGDKAVILRNNIFGVDIDPQAVEITMMSLYIKMLEGERSAIAGQGVLPRLSANIRCGNSLIAHDIRDFVNIQGDAPLNDEDMRRINPFDWDSRSEGFGDIVATGGFDAVIGNPPYGAELSFEPKNYIAKYFQTTQYKFDSFAFFIEKGINLLARKGLLGYIVPNTWLDTKTFSRLRKFILKNCDVQQVVNLGHGVFQAQIDTALLFVKKERNNKSVVQVIDASNSKEEENRIQSPYRIFTIPQDLWERDNEFRFNVYTDPKESRLFQKVSRSSIQLGEITESSQGLIPYNTRELSSKNPYISNQKSGINWKPFLDRGACISRYSLEWNGLYINYGKWLYTPNQPKYYENEKILIQRHRNPSLQRRIVATFDKDRYYFKDNLCCLISVNDCHYDLRYILGIINSALLNTFYKKNFTEVSLNPIYLRQLPIHAINFSDPAEKALHDKMVALVERMLDLHKQKQAAKSDTTSERVEREINVMDEKIDALVYELYGLTKEEIKIAEGT
jgi:type I restriction-modification system DNA methylase subunit